MRSGTLLLLALIAACASERSAPPATDTTPAAAASAPPDSLVLATGPYQVWLTDARPARDSSGAPCLERSVEIRTDSSRVRVPLLYVLTPPTVLDPRHLQADLALDCRAIARYRVELATGRPTRMASR